MTRLLLFEQGIAELGKQLTFFALPVIAVVTLGASVLEVGLLATVAAASALAGGVFSARTVATLGLYVRIWFPVVFSSAALLVVFLGGVSDWLRVEFVFATGAVTGFCGPMLRVSYLTAVKRTVSQKSIFSFNGRANLVQAVVSVAAPTVVGIVTAGGVSPLYVLPVNVASFVFTAIALHWVVAKGASVSSGVKLDSPLDHDNGGGSRMDAKLRNQALSGIGCETLWVFCRTGVSAVVVVYVLEFLGRSEFSVGLVMTAGGVGFVTGAALASLGSTMIHVMRIAVFLCSALCALLLLLLSLGAHIAFFSIACFTAFSAVGYIVLDVMMTSWRQVRLEEKDFVVFSSWSETATTAARLGSGAAAGLLGHHIGIDRLMTGIGVVYLLMTIILVFAIGKIDFLGINERSHSQ